MRSLRRLVIAVLVSVAAHPDTAPAQPVENPFQTVAEAYEWLLSSPAFPTDRVPQDDLAIARIQRQPELLVDQLQADLNAAAADAPTFDRSYAVFLNLGDTELQLGLARAAQESYGLTDRAPFSLYLAARGTGEDLARLRREMEADPNGWAVGLTLAIVFGENPEGLEMLQALRESLPGAWQASLPGQSTGIPTDTIPTPDGTDIRRDLPPPPLRLEE